MKRSALFQALLAILLWSTLAYLAVALSDIPPFLLLGVSLTIGSLCSIHKFRLWKVPLKTFIVGVTGIFCYHLCLFIAFRFAPAVEANLINYLWPLLIVVLSPVFLKGYTLNKKHIFAAILGFCGALLIVSGGNLQFNGDHTPGYLLAAAAALIWSSYSLMTIRLAPFPSAAVGLFCLVSGLLSIIIHLVLEDPYPLKLIEYPYLFLLGVGPLGLAFYFWDSALKQGDPRVIGSLAYLTPLISTMLLVLSGVGKFTLVSFIAIVLIVGGAMVGTSKI